MSQTRKDSLAVLSGFWLQVVSFTGALLVLSAFIASTYGRMSNHSFLYAFLNFSGTFLLALSMLSPLNFGGFFVEAVWSLASLRLCFKALSGRSAAMQATANGSAHGSAPGSANSASGSPPGV